jgi:phosphoribosylaminoimidazole-succinocarboxamide synthase
MGVERGALLYRGKAKEVYAVEGDRGHVILRYTDEATAFNGAKRASVAGKGEVNARISAWLLERVAAAGVPTAHVCALSGREHLQRRVEIVPVEVVVRNLVAGSLARRLGLDEGTPLARPVIEHFHKSDALNDPQVSEDVAVALGWARRWELSAMREHALTVNEVLRNVWAEHGITLVDFKLEFGRLDGAIVLADEITPDGARLWETATGRRLDKDVFRRDLGDLSDTYRDLLARVFGSDRGSPEG